MKTAEMAQEHLDYERFARQRPSPPVSKRQSLRHRVAQNLEHQAYLIQALEPGVHEGQDPEFLHQFRVNLRRSRAIAEALQRALEAHPLRKGIKGLKRQARETSHLRDLDVFLETLAVWQQDPRRRAAIEASGTERIVRASQREEHQRIRNILKSRRYQKDINRWRSLVRDGSIEDAARRLKRKHIRKALEEQIVFHDRLLGTLTVESPDSDIHRVRKSLKRIRYLIELDPEHLAGGIRKLKSRQKRLGQFQDRHVQVILLEDTVAPALEERQLNALNDLITEVRAEKLAARQRVLALKPLGQQA
ncbi:MAG: CHAD domain-containing protein [Pseudomonadota bacterium]